MLIFIAMSDGRSSRWMFDLDQEDNTAVRAAVADSAVLVHQRERQPMSQDTSGFDGTEAYLRQFEQWGGTQWLPHSY
jgi:hypothetical protein